MVTNSFGLIPDKFDFGVFYIQTDRIQLKYFLMISPWTQSGRSNAGFPSKLF